MKIQKQWIHTWKNSQKPRKYKHVLQKKSKGFSIRVIDPICFMKLLWSITAQWCFQKMIGSGLALWWSDTPQCNQFVNVSGSLLKPFRCRSTFKIWKEGHKFSDIITKLLGEQPWLHTTQYCRGLIIYLKLLNKGIPPCFCFVMLIFFKFFIFFYYFFFHPRIGVAVKLYPPWIKRVPCYGE